MNEGLVRVDGRVFAPHRRLVRVVVMSVVVGVLVLVRDSFVGMFMVVLVAE